MCCRRRLPPHQYENMTRPIIPEAHESRNFTRASRCTLCRRIRGDRRRRCDCWNAPCFTFCPAAFFVASHSLYLKGTERVPTPSTRSVHNRSRVRAARQQLLAGQAESLIEQVREVFCEPTRAQIVRALEVGALSVSDLAAATGRSRPAISQHLRVLRQSGIVQTTRRGRLSLYALTTEHVTTTAVETLEVVVRAA